MLRFDQVTFSYDSKVNVLDNVTLHIQSSQVLGLLGHNGAGKTTMLRLILGLLHPQRGNIQVNGFVPWQSHLPRTLIGYMPEIGGIYERLTGYQNLEFRARAAGKEPPQIRQQSDKWLERLSLLEKRKEKAGYWSKGLRQRLSLACALISQPSLLLLDEPTNGLDPESLVLVINILRELHAEGTTIIISSHDLNSITKLCSQIAVLQKGKLVYTGALTETTEQLQDVYLRLTKSESNGANS